MWGTDIKTFRVAKTTQKCSDVIDGGAKIDKDDGKHFHYVYTMRKQGLSEPKMPEEEEDEEE